MPIDPIPPVQPIGFDARSTPRQMTPAEAREWLLSLPGMTAEHVDGALGHPNGFMGTDSGGTWFAAYRLPNGNYSVEQIDAPYEKEAKEIPVKKPRPQLIIGPRIVEDEIRPRVAAREQTLQEWLLAERGMSLGRTTRTATAFDPNDLAQVLELVPKGYRIYETPEVPVRRYICGEPSPEIAKACSTNPDFGPRRSVPMTSVKSGAEPVVKQTRQQQVDESERAANATAIKLGLQPTAIVGVSTREQVAAERAA